jgi:hypothetical protein
MTQHLSHEQLCDVLLADMSQAPADPLDMQREHLTSCLICASELDLLSGSVSRFRASSNDYVDRQFARRRLRQPFAALYQPYSRGFFNQPLSWTVAALVLAVTLPIGMHFRRPVASPANTLVSTAAQTTESDEALLEGVNQDLTAAVPSPMQPLADPTASEAQPTSSSTQRKN